MVDTDDLALWYAINRLISNYWADVDDNGGSQAHEFYEREAVYTVGANRFEGADKIRAFYIRRRQYGRITTRHLISNLRVFREDEHHALAAGVVCLYRADGLPPVERMRPPAMISDFEARCRFSTDQVWRLQSHTIRPIFVSSDHPASITIDPKRL